MSSVIGSINLIDDYTLFAFLCSRTYDVSRTCQVSEISNPKPTIKCFTMNYRLFIHISFNLACTGINVCCIELGNVHAVHRCAEHVHEISAEQNTHMGYCTVHQKKLKQV